MYLQMDGVDDNLISATLNCDAIEIECYINSTQSGSGRYILDGRSGLANSHMQYDFNGDNLFWDRLYIGGVLQPSANPMYMLLDTKFLFRLEDLNGGSTDNIHIFCSYINHAELSGKIYNVKLFLGANLLAHYDMNTGTVQDQSGNGNHATLVGGTWVSEGGPTVVDAGVIGLSASGNLLSQASKLAIGNSTIQATSSLNSVGTKVNNGQSGLTAKSSLSALANRIINSTSTMNANSSLSADGEIISLQVSANLSSSSTMQAIGTRIRESDTDLSANSSFTAEGEAITFEITANLSASSQFTANGTLLKSGESALSANGNMLATGSVIYDGESVFFASSELSALLGETSILIGTVQLEGSKELNIYLQASKELEVTLQAKKELYVNLKGVMN